MPRSHVYLARNFAETWDGVGAAWFDRGRRQSWREQLPTVALVPSRAHGYFLRSVLLKEKTSFAGIHFWTPVEVRAFLLARFDSGQAMATRETLRLLLTTVANANTGGAAVALDPDGFLRVIDQIEAAGWDASAASLPLLGELAKKLHRAAAALNLQSLPQTDKALLETARNTPPVVASLLLCGFNAAHWPLWNILRAAVRAAEHSTICLQAPALSEINEAWVGSWEEEFGAAEFAPATDVRYPFEELGEAIERGEPVSTHGSLLFRIGANTREQAEAIVAQTIAWLAHAQTERIGLVFPGYGALSREVAAQLRARQIPHHDSVGHLRPGLFESEVWRAWLRLQENPRVNTLVAFVHALPESALGGLRADEIERTLRDAFAEILINDLAVLAAYLARAQRSERHRKIAAFLDTICLLPEEGTLCDFNAATSRVCEQFGWTAQADELTRQAKPLEKFANVISRRNYLRWLRDVIASFQRTREESGSHPYARVQLVSYSSAQGQRWSHLILTSLNEGVWPARALESGYLSEHEIEDLNGRILARNRTIVRQGRQGEGHLAVAEGKAFYLGPRQQRHLAQRQFVELVESAREAVCLTASLLDENDPARRLKPGDFFNRAYFADRGTPISDREIDVLHEETQRLLLISRFPSPPADEKQIAPMLFAFRARRDLAQPFGPYEFALATPPARPVTIPCHEWNDVVPAPARIWMKHFAGVEAPIYDEQTDPWTRALGTWVHHWLAAIAPKSDRFVRFPTSTDFLQTVGHAANQWRAEIEQLVAETGRTLPDWWRSIWGQAAFFSGELARLMSTANGWPFVATEYSLKPPVAVACNNGREIRVGGRIDLLLADQAGTSLSFHDRRVWVVDYKTGGYTTVSRKELEKGNGFQLALYALALAQLGADDVALSVIKPDVAAQPQLTLADLTEFNRAWAELARMQDTGIFGANGDMRSEFGRGAEYPLATLLIETDVLAEKWERTHGSFVEEQEEDAE